MLSRNWNATFLKTVAIFAAASPACAVSSRPNIVLIFSDDHAYQAISAYGSKLTQTPNIDSKVTKAEVVSRKLS